MSKIKDLRTNSENIINIVDLLSLFCPEGKESKYVDMLIRIMKNTKDIKNYSEEVIGHFSKEYKIERSVFENFTPIQLIFLYRFLDTTFNENDLKSFQKFCQYNERGLVPENDLTKYKSIEQINKSVSIAEVKVVEKEMENQVKKIHEDDEWLVLRPLTFDASKKYGSSTKWCTTTENNPDYFNKYAGNGILIYNLNKKTGLKVACYRATNGDNEFSFWNQVDTRIDSLQSELPMNILDVIRKEVKDKFVSNKSLLSDDLKKQEKRKDLFGSPVVGRSIGERVTEAVEREHFEVERVMEEEVMEQPTMEYVEREYTTNDIIPIPSLIRREIHWGNSDEQPSNNL